jgi:hypothetical protein
LGGGNGEDSQIRREKCAAHGANLGETSSGIDEARAGIWFDIVKDNGYASASGLQNFEHTEELLRKAAVGPGESGVLNEDTGIAPIC